MDIGRNNWIQKIENLYFPEFSMVYPNPSTSEFQILFPKLSIILPEIGFYELEASIIWKDLLKEPIQKFINPKYIKDSVFIPKNINSLQVSFDEGSILEELNNPKTEEEFLENLPFDMKKVMEGNEIEIEKYLKYLEENPEFALKHALPLDTLNLSRGDLKGSFNFDKSFFSQLSSRSQSEYSSYETNSNRSLSGSNFNESEPGCSSYFKDSLKIILVIFLLIRFLSFSLREKNSFEGGGTVLLFIFLFFGLIGFLYYISTLKQSLHLSKVFNVIAIIAVFYCIKTIYETIFLYVGFNYIFITVTIAILVIFYKIFFNNKINFKK